MIQTFVCLFVCFYQPPSLRWGTCGSSQIAGGTWSQHLHWEQGGEDPYPVSQGRSGQLTSSDCGGMMEFNMTRCTMKILVRLSPPWAARCDTFTCVKVEVEMVPRRNVGLYCILLLRWSRLLRPSMSDQKMFGKKSAVVSILHPIFYEVCKVAEIIT